MAAPELSAFGSNLIPPAAFNRLFHRHLYGVINGSGFPNIRIATR
jgi:hypothetical protein